MKKGLIALSVLLVIVCSTIIVLYNFIEVKLYYVSFKYESNILFAFDKNNLIREVVSDNEDYLKISFESLTLEEGAEKFLEMDLQSYEETRNTNVVVTIYFNDEKIENKFVEPSINKINEIIVENKYEIIPIITKSTEDVAKKIINN